MKIKKLVSLATLALAAVAAPFAARAVAVGDIHSIDLVADALHGGRVPTMAEPLRIGEKAVIRVRLVDRNPGSAEAKPWRFVKNPGSEAMAEYFAPQLGLKFGGQSVFATLTGEPVEVANPANTFTDFFFEYIVKSGDLAMPSHLMTVNGEPASSEISLDYKLQYVGGTAYWLLNNADGDVANFHFRAQGTLPEVYDPPGETQNFCVSGLGMGLYVKTIGFDTNYAEESETESEPDIWRKVYEGMTTTTTLLPALQVEGASEQATTMYVWVDDDKVAAPLKTDGAREISDVIGGKTIKRQVLPVSVAKGAAAVSFKIKGLTLGQTKVCLSSSEHLVADDMGFLVTNWIEEVVQVVEAPSPFVALNLVDPAGDPLVAAVSCSSDYQNYVAALVVTLSKAPTDRVVVDVTPVLEDGDIFADKLLGISTTTDGTPWVNQIRTVTFEAGETMKTLYIYALGSTAKLSSFGVKFTPNTSGPGAGMFQFDDKSHTANLVVKYAKPVVIKPTAETTISDAMAGQTYSLDFKISDSYKYLRESDGYDFKYRVKISGQTGSWQTLNNVYIDPDSGEGTADIEFDDEGEGYLEIYVINTAKQSSEHVNVPIEVGAPKKAWAELDHADNIYAEGETARVKFFVNPKVSGGKALYAFLKPITADATNKMASTGFTTSVPAVGCPISPGDGDSGNNTIAVSVLDGEAVATYEVIICKNATYSEAQKAGYAAGQFTITGTNVCPFVKTASMSGYEIEKSGTTVPKAVAQGVTKTFRVDIGSTEPSQLDLDGQLLEDGTDNRFYTQWKFGNDDWVTVYGNPSTVSTNKTFYSPGDQKIQVRVQDKDMRKLGRWSESFNFTVKVLDVPSVVVTPRNGYTYQENDIGENLSRFDVSLTAAPEFASNDDRLVIDLVVELVDPSGKYATTDCVLSKQRIEFRSGQDNAEKNIAICSFYLQQLDGTSGSASRGFRIKAVPTAESMAKDVEGKKWDSTSVEINVVNDDPDIITPVEYFDSEGKPISQTTTVGAKQSLSWALKDVEADRKGMKVVWTTSEGKKTTYIQGTGVSTEDVVYRDDVMTGTHEFTFDTSGDKSVTITVQDKDGGQKSRTLYYTIAASKVLEVVPHGPPNGNGTALSARYQDNASGLGAGRVWADNLASISSWVFKYNCGLDSTFRVYGRGYKVGEVDPDVTENGTKGGGYKYPEEKDSFLYAWLQIVQEEDSAKPTDEYLAVVPEHREGKNSGTLVNLPTEKDDDEAYPKTSVEAIFSKEYLVSDNMGDINQDGIPDIYTKKYEFGIFDEDGNVAQNDLTPITVSKGTGNLDEDYLPRIGYSSLGSLIPDLATTWATAGTAFDARLEIRGYHDGLNDAPALVGITGVKPDRIYAEEVEGVWQWTENCTISRLEYLAFQVWSTAHIGPDAWKDPANWALWSPERPTDPTESDTDDDGLTDGYEYFFWYRAHVGFEDANGVHRFLTGRRYDPRNPGEGKPISASLVARLMDPRSDLKAVDFPTDSIPDASASETRDTDNDGLPDAIEFVLGTNPVDFDTDGDGLPDGWEVMIAGTDPLTAYTVAGTHDALRNYDGDAMAFSSTVLESNVLPKPASIAKLYTFAVRDERKGLDYGDSNGVQWFIVRPEDYLAAEPVVSFKIVGAAAEGEEPAYQPIGTKIVTADGTAYVCGGVFSNGVAVVEIGGVKRLAVDLPKNLTYRLGSKVQVNGEKYDDVALTPSALAAGTQVTSVETEFKYKLIQLDKVTKGKFNAGWLYGQSSVSGSGVNFGMITIGRYLDPEVDDAIVVCEEPRNDREVAYIHSLVYQEFGFDPRTAWNPNTPLATRWGVGDYEDQTTSGKGSYVGKATRTRAYTAYDEFLLYSFFLNANVDMAGYTRLNANAPDWAVTWGAYTTNPQGPNEEIDQIDGHYYGRSSDQGADTDGDGVPDGWELYVMAGPKETLKDGSKKYVFAPPYAGFAPACRKASLGESSVAKKSYWSPFVASAQDSATDNQNYTGESDNLNEWEEFAGTDSCAYYEKYSATILRPEAHVTWVNKFFPTDPWNSDTDGDGIKDGNEFGYFIYEGNTDSGKVKCLAGGGLNPCTIDTDMDGLPDGWEADYAGKTLGEDPKNGYIDGMDGTVADARTTTPGGIDRDYDHDGLENFQEYLTGAMRCWRYDDPLSTWTFIADDCYYLDGQFDVVHAVKALAAQGKLDTKFDPENDDDPQLKVAIAEFWVKTAFDMTSEIYNPYLVTGTAPGGMYWTRVRNGWDINYTDTDLTPALPGTYYFLRDRVNGSKFADLWKDRLPEIASCPIKRYMGCSPIDPDTDGDGMDDYYELFHGLNPLLGACGTNGKDKVFDAYYENGKYLVLPWGTMANYWTGVQPRAGEIEPRGNGYDFRVYPWLAGLPEADPDGDDIRNQIEAIMPLQATSTWRHTDPTPLWMTDSSYSNSFTRMFYRLPRRSVPVAEFGIDPITDENGDKVPGVEFAGKKYYFRDAPGFDAKQAAFPAFIPDAFKLSANEAFTFNWAFSFEENEGFDSDHDAISDYEEVSGKFRAATDPQDADSPHRRQAMYFPGENAVLQTLPQVEENHPIGAYPKDPSFLQFTVECWASPDEITDASQVIVERVIWSGVSNPGDEEYIRKNFQLAIREGHWYAKFDSNGTRADGAVEVLSTDAATTGWHHLAATYDGSVLMLYVDGKAQVPTHTELQPEYGVSAISVTGADSSQPGLYRGQAKYSSHAILVGGALKTAREGGDGKATDLTQGIGWKAYHEFFKGYVDEVRIWDGARSQDEIKSTMRTRYTRELALENRTAFYAQWYKGLYRYDATAGVRVVPELRYHFHFDSVPGAANATDVAKAPHGFDYYSTTIEGAESGKAFLSRPVDYEIGWWKGILTAYPGTVYDHPAWVQWIPNTVTHLPRFDGSTLDSQYWSANYCGWLSGTYAFARTAEPVSLWTQYTLNAAPEDQYWTTLMQQYRATQLQAAAEAASNTTTTVALQYLFTGRHLNQSGDDLLPLGGAFVKYCSLMWDDQGASTTWEIAATDGDNDGLPDWWDAYARENYMPEGTDPSVPLTWDTIIVYDGVSMTAGEAYRRDLAKGTVPVDGKVTERAFPQVADENNSGIPDWWEDLYQISGLAGTDDTDNDGLNNRVEYLVTEVYTNFNIRLNPRMPSSDTVTLDYFRTAGSLYLGEMFTDHDLVEDDWERLAGSDFADANVWDALRDADEDGWTNADERRYNAYALSTLPKLISHAVGDSETLDAPIPTIKLTVRYNEKRALTAGDSKGDDDQKTGSLNLVVESYTDPDLEAADAKFTVTPGTAVEKEVYLGGWEDRTVHGTMAPGHIDIGSIDILFAQIPQSDRYSWTDENGTHVSASYAEFKEALARNPDIIQNIVEFKWMNFVAPQNEFTTADKAVTVTRSGNEQTGYLAVYGERVGTINLETGEFEFDMHAMSQLSISGIYDSSKGESSVWGIKEAIFKITYSSLVPTLQSKICNVSLAKADTGFVKGGCNTLVAYYDLSGDGYTPGVDPMGIVRDVNVGWNGASAEVELTTMSAVSPRVNLWSNGDSDREVRTAETEGTDKLRDRFGGNDEEAETLLNGNVSQAAAAAVETRVRVLRYQVDSFEPFKAGTAEARVMVDRVFKSDVRSILHEGDFLRNGELDLDWSNLANEVVNNRGVIAAGGVVTNVNYLILFGDGPIDFAKVTSTNTLLTAHPLMISRRFEKYRTAPTAVQDGAICYAARPTFSWKIENEDSWASRYGTTYTAFKVKVWNAAGELVYDSGARALPAPDSTGVYTWTAPLSAGAPSPSGSHLVFENLANYTWQVFTYNAKFRTDANGSEVMNLRMNVTAELGERFEIPVHVSYAGPAKNLSDRIHVQAFETPDFAGDPAAEVVVSAAESDVVIPGLAAGTYYLRAYVDTDFDFTRATWESWGYLCARDLASVGGVTDIFSPSAVKVGSGLAVDRTRILYIEDCDTNGNCFPDAWEAEQNGNVFDPNNAAVSGDAELLAVNPQLLTGVLNKEDQFAPIVQVLTALRSRAGVALMSGLNISDVSVDKAGASYVIESTVEADTLKIIGIDIRAAENAVEVKVGAEVSGSVDDGIASLLGVTVRKGADVKVNVYHTETLAGAWQLKATATIRVEKADSSIRVVFDQALPTSGFFRAEVAE